MCVAADDSVLAFTRILCTQDSAVMRDFLLGTPGIWATRGSALSPGSCSGIAPRRAQGTTCCRGLHQGLCKASAIAPVLTLAPLRFYYLRDAAFLPPFTKRSLLLPRYCPRCPVLCGCRQDGVNVQSWYRESNTLLKASPSPSWKPLHITAQREQENRSLVSIRAWLWA